jgi:hypothetical protein
MEKSAHLRSQESASMKNITVAVTDRAYHDARVWAARRDTSLSKVVQNFLEALPRLRSAQAFPLAGSESDIEDQDEIREAAEHPVLARLRALLEEKLRVKL